jgi:hypothetical protein
MASEYTLYRMAELKKAIQLLRETIEVNFPPNAAIELNLQGCELEATLLGIQLNKEK